MKSYGLEENVEKRNLCKEKINFLGYEIQMNKIKPNLNRAQGIIDFERPRSKKSLQRFLGLLNYDRIFVKNITESLARLYKLLRKDNNFAWDKEQEDAFQKIKKHWGESLELQITELKLTLELESDASNTGIGAVLKQENIPVAYVSRSLSKVEKSYSTTESEVLASIWAMEKLRYFLSGKKFNLVTDHKAIEELKTKKEIGSFRVQRWVERLDVSIFQLNAEKGQR